MSEPSKIIDALDVILKADATLSALVASKNYHKYNDEMELVNVTKLFPFVNVDIEVRTVGKAGNQRTYDYERRTYPIIIKFAVREKTKAVAKTSIWTLAEAVEGAYQTDKTIGGTVTDIPMRADIATDCLRHKDNNRWIGRGFMTFEVYKDECLR